VPCGQGGFIWLFYGSEQLPAAERPPIPMVPELEDPAWKPVRPSPCPGPPGTCEEWHLQRAVARVRAAVPAH